VRSGLVIVTVLLDLTAPAMACPPLDTCLTQLPSTTRVPRVSSAHDTDAEPDAGASSHVREPALDVTQLPELAPPRRAPPGVPAEVEMPAIWMVLRTSVYSRMPTYQQSHDFKLVLSPVVVSSPSDTIPGLGVSGDF
jgi:hypothetical protein